jgi:hypothetical protein
MSNLITTPEVYDAMCEKTKKEIKGECPFADNYVNKEGWFTTAAGEIVCLDWDDFCTRCMKEEDNE